MAERLAAVTGATGFLGRHIVEALRNSGWRVRILARNRLTDDDPDEVAPDDTILGDIADRQALDALIDGADVVIHAAGLIKAPSLAAFRAVTAAGAANLVAVLNDCHQRKRLVLVSSMAAREPHLSAYAATKREGENAVTDLRGHDWLIVRPCAVYGPRDRETLALFQAAARGIIPLAGPSLGRVALIHAADAADAVAGLCADGPGGRVFELTDSRIDGYSWPEIAAAAKQAVGVRALTLPLPALAVRAAASVNLVAARIVGRTPIFTPGKAREILHADWSSSPDQLPPTNIWQPRIALGAGFAETVAWYREQRWLPAGQDSGS